MSEANGKWSVVAEPEGKNPGAVQRAAASVGVNAGKNMGGMVIYVVGPDNRKEEVSRVAWVRRNSKNPKASFEKQFKIELDKARESVKVLNDLAASAGELQ